MAVHDGAKHVSQAQAPDGLVAQWRLLASEPFGDGTLSDLVGDERRLLKIARSRSTEPQQMKARLFAKTTLALRDLSISVPRSPPAALRGTAPSQTSGHSGAAGPRPSENAAVLGPPAPTSDVDPVGRLLTAPGAGQLTHVPRVKSLPPVDAPDTSAKLVEKWTEVQTMPQSLRSLAEAFCKSRFVLCLRAGWSVVPALVRLLDWAAAVTLFLASLILVTRPGWVLSSLARRFVSVPDLIIAWFDDEDSSLVGPPARPYPPHANLTIIEAVPSPRGYDATHLSYAAIAGALLNQMLARGGV